MAYLGQECLTKGTEMVGKVKGQVTYLVFWKCVLWLSCMCLPEEHKTVGLSLWECRVADLLEILACG